jgi:hypothetical protein
MASALTSAAKTAKTAKAARNGFIEMFLVRSRGIAEKRSSLSRERPPLHIGHRGHAL